MIAHEFPANITSPIFRIHDLDANRDTPVEILHVVLLGFVKYFWRDTIAHILKEKKPLLKTRLSSLDVSALGIPPLVGETLVTYAGSLTGRDFRTISQVAPFVLYDLVPYECYEAWLALCTLVPLIWQPEIDDIEAHLVKMEAAINHFLRCTARWTPRWFNKPKFHIIRHLVAHVRRFGPAILFATEGFESFNAIVRSKSVHSNRHAPSRDIAQAFARANRIRHLLSGGRFLKEGSLPRSHEPLGLPTDSQAWVSAGHYPLALATPRANMKNIITHYYGLNKAIHAPPPHALGLCLLEPSPSLSWHNTLVAPHLPMTLADPQARLRRCKSVQYRTNETYTVGAWVLFQQATLEANYPSHTQHQHRNLCAIRRVMEIIQVCNSPHARTGHADWTLIQTFVIAGPAKVYGFPQLRPGHSVTVKPLDVICTVNVQHMGAQMMVLLQSIRSMKRRP